MKFRVIAGAIVLLAVVAAYLIFGQEDSRPSFANPASPSSTFEFSK